MFNSIRNTFSCSHLQNTVAWRDHSDTVHTRTQMVLRLTFTRKLTNFNFRWTKTLYQNNFKHIAFFFTLFNGYKCNKGPWNNYLKGGGGLGNG